MSEKKEKSQGKPGEVEVKILKNMGAYRAGDVVWVTEEVAKSLCLVNNVPDGKGGVISKVRAMYLKDHKEMEEALKKSSDLSQAEAKELDLKNKAPDHSEAAKAELAKAEEEAKKAAEAKEGEDKPEAKKGKK